MEHYTIGLCQREHNGERTWHARLTDENGEHIYEAEGLSLARDALLILGFKVQQRHENLVAGIGG